MTDQALALVHEQPTRAISPTTLIARPLSVTEVQQRYRILQEFKDAVLRPNVDYGAVPGTGEKPTLLQPGAQKLCVFFGLHAEFDFVEREEDWMGARHGGEPFFRYLIRCRLITEDGREAGQSYSDINSWEARYRWRWVEEVDLPSEFDPGVLRRKASFLEEYAFAIEAGKTDGKYGKPPTYWQMWRQAIQDRRATPVMRSSKDGRQIEAFRLESCRYRIPNEDIFSQINSLIKIGQKRSLVGATLNGTGASEFFTQDLDDFAPDDAAVMTMRPALPDPNNEAGNGGQTDPGQAGSQKPNGQQTPPAQPSASTGTPTNWRSGEAAKLIPALRQSTGITDTNALFKALEQAGAAINPTMAPEAIAAVLKGGGQSSGGPVDPPAQPRNPSPRQAPLKNPISALAEREEPLGPDALYMAVRATAETASSRMSGGVSAKQKTEIAMLVGQALPEMSGAEMDDIRHALTRFLFNQPGVSDLSKAQASAMIDWLMAPDGKSAHPMAVIEIHEILALMQEIDLENEQDDSESGSEAE